VVRIVHQAHYYMGVLQPKLNLAITWDFLAPNEAHNRADGAAAHWKAPQKKLIKNFSVLSDIGHLAFACSKLETVHMIAADWNRFFGFECPNLTK